MTLLASIAIARATTTPAPAVPYDIVYVRLPRAGDATKVWMPEVFDPIRIGPGADLMLLRPDGTEEILVAGGNGAIVDPVLSFDAEWVFYAKFHDQRPSALNEQRRHASRAGADLYKIHLASRRIVRLTHQEWTPNTGAADWARDPLGGGEYFLGYGIFNLGPSPLPDGRIMFTSSRNGFLPNRELTFPNLQLFVMDEDGANVELVGPMSLGSALHPTVLADGRVMFSTYETQGIRDSRLWGLWAMWPDGRNWMPLMSALTESAAFHFQTQLTNGLVGVIDYYNLNNRGFGTLLAFPATPPADTPWFGEARPASPSNPSIQRGIWFLDPSRESHLKPRVKRYPFSPYGLHTLTPFAHGEDEASSRLPDGSWAGKVTHPSGAPGNDVLLVWTPGPANDLNRPASVPAYDAGLYLLRGGRPASSPRDLVLIKNDPAFNELQPRAVVPYRAVYGVDAPARIPWLPNDGSASPLVPAGSPFGLVGTSTFYKRNTSPGIGNATFGGLDAFNTTSNSDSSNFVTQGADAGRYTNDDIFAVRILALEPTSHRSYGPAEGAGFRNHTNERMRILGEIPLRKHDAAGQPVRDADGNPDTSFLARIPADTPFTFQTLDRDGLALNTSQTWHQLRPGEVRNNCGGCHAHSQIGTDFAGTAAARPGYGVADLTRGVPLLTKDSAGATLVKSHLSGAVDVEYYRDIKPLLQRSCVPCHSARGRQEAQLVLDDTAVVGGYENTYHRLANDPEAAYGRKPLIGVWRSGNASRYVRALQSRRSLLVWKVFGRRLDGWTNADFPTESRPGDRTTLPAGAHPNDADIDFVGAICPTPDSGVPPLSEDEKMLFARWVDLGAPITSPADAFRGRGWFQDDLRPTLTVSSPRAGALAGPIDILRVGAWDYYSGLDRRSLSIKASFPVNGRRAGSELAPLFSEEDGVWTLRLVAPVFVRNGLLTASVKDEAGNITRIERRFSNSPPVR